MLRIHHTCMGIKWQGSIFYGKSFCLGHTHFRPRPLAFQNMNHHSLRSRSSIVHYPVTCQLFEMDVCVCALIFKFRARHVCSVRRGSMKRYNKTTTDVFIAIDEILLVS